MSEVAESRKVVGRKAFVRGFKNASSYEEVASILNMDLANVKNRAKKYRDKGINLPVFDTLTVKGQRKLELDADALNAILNGDAE